MDELFGGNPEGKVVGAGLPPMKRADKSAVGAVNRPLHLFHPPVEAIGLGTPVYSRGARSAGETTSLAVALALACPLRLPWTLGHFSFISAICFILLKKQTGT
ncbi:MAG: hypothetical protein ACJ788_19135 [Ktedonobacteraceae bacterium]